MKTALFTTIAIAASLAAATQAARADDITVDTTPFVSTKSRSEVQAELRQFQAADVNVWSTSYTPLKTFHSEKTRAEVRAEFLENRNEAAAFNGEDSGSRHLAEQSTSPRHVLLSLAK
ncbi:MAG TPA: hypothetical protein VHC20_05275 [Candidatus Paceibacterota bacterium]|nr:hypothetical protein [Candidatus Paceibacterota bacterium]